MAFFSNDNHRNRQKKETNPSIFKGRNLKVCFCFCPFSPNIEPKIPGDFRILSYFLTMNQKQKLGFRRIQFEKTNIFTFYARVTITFKNNFNLFSNNYVLHLFFHQVNFKTNVFLILVGKE